MLQESILMHCIKTFFCLRTHAQEISKKETYQEKTAYAMKSAADAGIPATTNLVAKPVKAFIVTNTLLIGGGVLIASLLAASLLKVIGLSWLVISLIFFVPILVGLVVVAVGFLAYKGAQYVQENTTNACISFSHEQIDKMSS